MVAEAQDRLKLSRALLANGQAEAASRLALESLRVDPRSHEAYVLLAEAEQQRGRLEHAVLALQRAASYYPDNADLWARLGCIHGLRASWHECARAHARAVESAPRDERHWASLAIAQLAAQQYNAAVATSGKLSAQFPDTAIAHLVEGHVLEVGGRFDDAARAYERAMELDPACANAAFNLVDFKAPALSDPLSRRIHELSARADVSDIDRMEIEFALARIYEASGRYDDAFEHYRKANEARQRDMRTQGLTYEPAAAERRTRETMQRFGDSRLRSEIAPLPIELRPIFIVGMPRSGTTLVEQILGCHPEVATGGELTAGQLCYSAYLADRQREQLPSQFDFRQPAELRLLERARDRYVEYLFENNLDAANITDKFPGNVQVLGFLRAMFPNAVILHCKRQPIATCWSLYSANLSAHAPYKTSLENLAHFYLQYLRLMEHWRQILDPPPIDVSYELLVADPEAETRRILAACELPWHEGCLNFHRSERPVTTASLRQVREPIYKSSLDRWRRYQTHLCALAALPSA